MMLLGALAGVAVVGGIVMIIAWFRPAPEKTGPRRRRSTSLATRWNRLGKRMQTMIVLGVIAGIVVTFLTQLPAMLVAVPAAFIGLPALLGKPETRERDLTAALEVWARSLSATAGTGAFTLQEVIGITRTSAPAMLRGAVDRLYARMNSTWTASRALHAFAEELDSDDADEVVVYLIQAAEYSAGGLEKALASVADALLQREKLQTEVFFEREKPRRSLTMMTWIAGFTLAVVVFSSSSDLMTLYKTPLGGIVMAILFAAFVLLLMWANSIVRAKPASRVLLERDGASA